MGGIAWRSGSGIGGIAWRRWQCTIVHRAMRVEWDREKARTNSVKHGVSFADAVTALEDEQAITVADEREAEARWVTIGMDGQGRLLVVVYTWRGNAVRVISARKATARERRSYEEAI